VTSRLGIAFEAEIREQPELWERIAAGDAATALAAATDRAPIVFLGSGSSRFVAQFAALAYRRAGVPATALAATEAAFDARVNQGRSVVAISQSGRSADVLAACDALVPARLIALTNDVDSPLAKRADVVIDLAVGPERAVPASKSVTAAIAIVRLAAGLLADERDVRAALARAAADVRAFLDRPHDDVTLVAQRLAARAVEVIGAGYGVSMATEVALKLKEAAYVQAEGFSAGEFRHGSTAILEPTGAVIALVDAASFAIVKRVGDEARTRGAEVVAFGGALGAGEGFLGPPSVDTFDMIRWLVTGQRLALEIGRFRGIDSDAPRGLRKALT
jgi:glucosamine--fructose-6-phosphate aminotransferase (isomerizing)